MPRAPSARAIARPTRRPAPVTSATWPASGSASGGGRTSERLDALVLATEPVDRDVHHADGAGAVGRAMPVGTPAGDEPQLVDDRAKSCRVLRRMARVPDFHAIETQRHQGVDALTRAAGSRMCQDGQPTSRVHHGDGLTHPELILRDVGRPPGAEVAIECVANV